MALQLQILCWRRVKAQAMKNSCQSRLVSNVKGTQILCFRSGADGQTASALLRERGDTDKDCIGSGHSCPASPNRPDDLSFQSKCCADACSAAPAEASPDIQVTSV